LLLDSRGGTKGNALQAGLKRRLSEKGSEYLFRGIKWLGIATPIVSDSYEAGRPLFARNVKQKNVTTSYYYSIYKGQHYCNSLTGHSWLGEWFAVLK
jgi:hypothetical protein